MPWHIVRREGQFCVLKDETDSTEGCHENRDDALAQLRALYASEADTAVADAEEALFVSEEASEEIPGEVDPVTQVVAHFEAAVRGLQDLVVTPVPAAVEVEEDWLYADGARPVLAAAGEIPVKPPRSWFDHVVPNRPGPISISSSGRYSGYLALRETAHIGIGGKRVTPPLEDDYRYFHLGSVETEEGEIVATGRITFDTGHADLSAGARPAAQHYDNTGSVGADVVAGVDEHGIWVEGALRPDLSDENIRVLRAAPLSGDWRRIGNKLRLVAALAVNVPGFPIEPEYALAASGEVEALIMAEPIVPEPGLSGELTNEQRRQEIINRQKKAQLIEKMRG